MVFFVLPPQASPPMFVCYYVFKTYVIEKLCLYGIMSKNMLFCLQSPYSSVSHKSLPLLGAPLSVGEGLGVRPYHGSERTKLIH